MDTLLSFFFPLCFFFFFFTHTVLCIHFCSPSSCGDSEPIVNFPFWLFDRQPYLCGYPGFDLSCNNQNQTVLDLPSSGAGEFIVRSVNYSLQSIYISDPNGCLPKKMESFTLSDSPFSASLTNFIFLNCTLSDWYKYSMYQGVLVPCLSSHNYRVVAMDASADVGFMPPSCRKWMVGFYGYHFSTVAGIYTTGTELKWDVPICRSCVLQGGICGFQSSSTALRIGCSTHSKGLPRSAKIGLILGVGIPGLLTFIGVACCVGGRTRTNSQRGGPVRIELFTITGTRQSTGVAMGLDGPTIESFPKTLLGESRRLPNPQDGTCPICLSEYQPKDTLRTIPDCNHYFHSNCIDEWLRLNSTCPLCRNSPDGSSGV